MTCSQCGQINERTAVRCSSCGAALPSTSPPPPPPATDARTRASWGQSTTEMSGRWALDRWVVGDWPGAIIAALAGLLLMFGLSAAVVALDPTPKRGLGGFLTQVLAVTILAVGGSVKTKLGTVDPLAGLHAMASVSVMPMFITLVGFAAIAYVFCRRLRARQCTGPTFLQQAFRLLIVVVVLLIAIGIAARHGDSARATDYVRVAVPYSVFFGACMTLVTLAVTFFFAFPYLLSGRARRWRDRFAGPATGLVVLFALCWLLGTTYALIQILAIPHHLSHITHAGLGNLFGAEPQFDATAVGISASRRGEFASLLAFSPNHAMWLLAWAMGVPLRIATQPHALQTLFGSHWSLTHFADHKAVYWVLPVIAAILWLTAAAVTALYGATPRDGQGNGLRLPLLTPVFTTGIFVMAGLAIHARLPGSGAAGLRLHFMFWWLLLLGIVWAGVAGIVAPQLVSRLSAVTVTRIRRPLVRWFGAPPAGAVLAAPDRIPPPPPPPTAATAPDGPTPSA
jgi:hypothetical protein